MTTPSWVNRELLEQALKTFFKTDILEVISYTSTNACGVGENYTSDIFRTSITYKKNKGALDILSVILKCKSESGIKRDIADQWHLFEKEVEIYKKTLNDIYNLLGEYNIVSSKCYFASTKPHSIIIMEDLAQSGYKMLPRRFGLDLETSLMVVEKLAKLHAGSFLAYKKDPTSIKNLCIGLHNDADDMVVKWVKNGYSGLVDACLNWPGYEKYGHKIQNLGDEALNRGFLAAKRKMGGFHVLNHGDIWINNMLVQFNSKGNVSDIRFVDFQMVMFTSPAADLHFYIATSLETSVHVDHLNLLLDHYYAQLLGNLTRLKHPLDKIPSREEFLKDFRNRSFFGLMVACTVTPFVKADKRDDAVFDNILSDTPFRRHAFNNEEYKKIMQCLLPFYDKFGILD